MNKVYIIGDVGSCHMGNEDQCIEAVRIGKECGLGAVKFQIGVSPPNIDIPFEYFDSLIETGNKHGIEVYASLFDDSLYPSYSRLMRKYHIMEQAQTCEDVPRKLIKFAYSQKLNPLQIEAKKDEFKVIVSCDVLSYYEPKHADVRLFCIPEYPVTKEISFDGLFPMFDGFSDHTMGYRQTLNAVRAGAKYIEKHFKLWEGNRPDSPPDGLFALSPKGLQSMVSEIRSIE